jgi:hypothetical protein
MADVTEGRDELRAMIRSFGSMLRAASREWLIRGTLGREDLRAFLIDSIVHLVNFTYPKVLAAKRGERTRPE